MRFAKLFSLALTLFVVPWTSVQAAPGAGTPIEIGHRGAIAAPDTTDPPLTLPYVDRIYTVPERPVDGDAVTIVLSGHFPYPCGQVFDPVPPDTGRVIVGLRPYPFCSQPPWQQTWAKRFPLGQLRAGRHAVATQLVVETDPASPDTSTTNYYGRFEFSVWPDSVTPPPPPQLGLPYVQSVRIVQAPNLLPVERPICPNDSIMVMVAGVFPNTCYSLKGIELIRYPTVGFAPAPPAVRLTVDSASCTRQVCLGVLVPWQAAIVFEPQSPGDYRLSLEMSVGSCRDSAFPFPQYTAVVPFAVSRECSTGLAPCVFGAFEHPNGEFRCDASISAGHAARVRFQVHSGVALSGLQGNLVVNPPGLRIVRMAPIGVASGMHLSWTQTREGARFVMFAPRGAPIPPSPWLGGTPPVSIIDVALEQPPNSPGQQITYVSARELLGSNLNGRGVPQCAPPPWARIAFDAFSARVCLDRECDFNADGSVDVRDLVLMVRCLNHEGPCPDSSGGGFDCNSDAEFHLDDVMCCARRILGQAPCSGCPPDTSPGRPEPSVSIRLGAPTASGSGLRVPIRLEGADRVGAARLVFDFPADRYAVTGIDAPAARADWLPLYEVVDGRLSIGLIRVNPIASEQALDVALGLELKPGQAPGGEIACGEAEFSGPDGVRLAVEMGRPSLPMGGSASILLSGARPNPFTRLTEFTLTLDRAADVEVGIYDIGGRLVAPIHGGPLAAGPKIFLWNGTRADGSRAENGIYFYRARSGGQATARKLVMLRGN